ncbi:serine/threonine-protein kinase [Haliangium sp.]|uniref:serine/threonine-protein kinase n=1 Tax=Haliangium sp. TaxID=2663208 RepID=UPI003D10D797
MTSPPAPARISSYRVEGLLGDGASAHVYRCLSSAGQAVAVKLARSVEHGPVLHREADYLSRIDSPRVPALVERGQTADGRTFLVSSLVDAVPLTAWHDFSRPLPPVIVGKLVLQLCEALGAIHAAGYAHLDLKPPNLLLARDGQLYLVDLGSAAPLLEPLPRPRGTREFMAPELYRGQPPGPATDVYGAGVLLYQLLTGRSPFFPNTVRGQFDPVAVGEDEWRRLHCSQAPTPLSRHVDGAGELGALGELVHQCLAKVPAERPETPALLGARLRVLLLS